MQKTHCRFNRLLRTRSISLFPKANHVLHSCDHLEEEEGKKNNLSSDLQKTYRPVDDRAQGRSGTESSLPTSFRGSQSQSGLKRFPGGDLGRPSSRSQLGSREGGEGEEAARNEKGRGWEGILSGEIRRPLVQQLEFDPARLGRHFLGGTSIQCVHG